MLIEPLPDYLGRQWPVARPKVILTCPESEASRQGSGAGREAFPKSPERHVWASDHDLPRRANAGQRARAHSLAVSCWNCYHAAIMSADPWPDGGRRARALTVLLVRDLAPQNIQ